MACSTTSSATTVGDDDDDDEAVEMDDWVAVESPLRWPVDGTDSPLLDASSRRVVVGWWVAPFDASRGDCWPSSVVR